MTEMTEHKVLQLGALKRVSELQGPAYRMVQGADEIEQVFDDLEVIYDIEIHNDDEYPYLIVQEGLGECDYKEVWGMYSAALSATAELIHVGG